MASYMGDDIVVNIPVQMASITDRDGKITPLWFRFENEEHVIEKIEIEQVLSRESPSIIGIHDKKFICSAIFGDMRHVVEIRYNIETQKWKIFKFLS